jgi:hypothetical protein
MLGLWGQNRLGQPWPAGQGESQPEAVTSLLIVRYPAALDVPPNIANNVTPLSGVFYNYLGAMVEAILAEIGPMDLDKETKGRFPTLMAFLGVELANRLSCWRSWDKVTGTGTGLDNEAGQVFGIIKQVVSTTAAGWNVGQSKSATTYQGIHPAGKNPLVFANPTAKFNQTSAQMAAGFGGGVRGGVSGQSGGVYSYAVRGHPSGVAPGSCSGAQTQEADVVLFFMVEGI